MDGQEVGRKVIVGTLEEGTDEGYELDGTDDDGRYDGTEVEGVDEGIDVEGQDVGQLLLGFVVGEDEGTVVGSTVGFEDGNKDGTREGMAEGKEDGTEVGDVDGVRVAGVLLQAGATSSPTLLKWGSKKAAGDASNPGVMSDIFARVGGPDSFETAAETMVSVQRGNVIGDVSVPDRPHIPASSCASCNFARGCEHREP